MDTTATSLRWHGARQPSTDAAGIYAALADLDRPCFIVRTPTGIAAVAGGSTAGSGDGLPLLAAVPPLPPRRLGARAFLTTHQVRLAYHAGAMANGISSADMVIALARDGILGTYGAAGLLPGTVEKALLRFAAEIPGLPYAVNLTHTPGEERREGDVVGLLLRHGVTCVEASGYTELSPHLLRYRLAGLRRGPGGRVVAGHRVIAKVSRPATAERFMRPAAAHAVSALHEQGLITAEQAELARYVPVADDVTAEADSAGHTDRTPLAALLPAVLRMRNTVQRQHHYPTLIRVGAAGGLGTPVALAAAFAMGADYVVTGSVNQACVESGASRATKAMLADAGIADVDMAPAADRFEAGVELQVLKRGTLFPMRARRLQELYQTYDSLEALPETERICLETQVFRRSLEEVWQECACYFQARDPAQLARAEQSPKRRMALVFRWYLGLSSRWSTAGTPDRTLDYQVWCGPAMGSFNDWVTASYLKPPGNRRVADVAEHLMRGAAFHTRIAQLRNAGVELPVTAADYRPVPLGTQDASSLGGAA